MKKVFILSLIILVLVSNVNAQLESKQCYDKCINNIFYSHGIFDVKKNKCIYKQEVCKYGCENKVKCRDYPTKLPKNDTDAREVIFDINKKIFDHVKTKIEIRGTEYYGGEYGKIFLHLSDGGHELNNGTCFITVYYPNTTKFIDNVGMTCLGENGLYYINFFVPENVFGVYMICAYCYIPRLAYNLTCITSSYDGFESGNWSGGYGWSDVWYQEGDSSIVTTGTTHNGTYHLRLRRGNAWVERSVNNLYDVKPELPWHSYKKANYDFTPFANDSIVELRFALQPLAWKFQKGHKIRFSVAGADNINYEFNPAISSDNTLENCKSTILKIHTGNTYQSYVELPIVK